MSHDAAAAALPSPLPDTSRPVSVETPSHLVVAEKDPTRAKYLAETYSVLVTSVWT